MRFLIALWAGKFIGFLIRLIDESRGSNLSGEKAMAIDPRMISHFKGIDPEKTIFITGTNGKSTTTNLLVHILRSNGKKVVANLEGANLLHGVATTLIKASSLTGRVSADYFVFETDERYLKAIREQLPAVNIMMTNLQKDQAQRNGEPDFVKGKIHDAVVLRDTVLYVNNEEPRVKSFESEVKKTITYG
ncbi:MAG: Mur ligase family protein, partial [Eubacterium sp.]|nr:Mur ligase family protein [Eubacterium sp.]